MKLKNETIKQYYLMCNDLCKINKLTVFDFYEDYTESIAVRKQIDKDVYIINKLKNPSSESSLKEDILKLFQFRLYSNDFTMLERNIEKFNQYFISDGYIIVYENKDLSIKKASLDDVKDISSPTSSTLMSEFRNVNVKDITASNDKLSSIVKTRIQESIKCYENELYLSSVIMCGSALEGLIIMVAEDNEDMYLNSPSAPTRYNSDEVKSIYKWTLKELIDVSIELNVINNANIKYSDALRNFRNFIHPAKELESNFEANEDFAKVSLMVFKSIYNDLKQYTK